MKKLGEEKHVFLLRTLSTTIKTLKIYSLTIHNILIKSILIEVGIWFYFHPIIMWTNNVVHYSIKYLPTSNVSFMENLAERWEKKLQDVYQVNWTVENHIKLSKQFTTIFWQMCCDSIVRNVFYDFQLFDLHLLQITSTRSQMRIITHSRRRCH